MDPHMIVTSIFCFIFPVVCVLHKAANEAVVNEKMFW